MKLRAAPKKALTFWDKDMQLNETTQKTTANWKEINWIKILYFLIPYRNNFLNSKFVQ